MTVMPTMVILTLRAHEWRAGFFPSGWYAAPYSERTDLKLKCRFKTSACVSRGSDENSRSKRMHIYVSLLKQMAPEHLLATFAKLCAEILAAASDGMLDTEDITGQSVLQVNLCFVGELSWNILMCSYR